MKFLASFFLLLSVILYFFQIFIYTENAEIIVYGAFGLFWYAMLYICVLSGSIKLTPIVIILLAGLGALGLGFTPHRLRLFGDFNAQIALFPVIHFLTTLGFLLSGRKVILNTQ